MKYEPVASVDMLHDVIAEPDAAWPSWLRGESSLSDFCSAFDVESTFWDDVSCEDVVLDIEIWRVARSAGRESVEMPVVFIDRIAIFFSSSCYGDGVE
jgi:hypothetical protein